MDEIVEFVIPLRYEDLEEEHTDRYYVQNVLELGSASSSIIQNCLKEVIDKIEEKAYNIHKHENFDTIYSLLKYASIKIPLCMPYYDRYLLFIHTGILTYYQMVLVLV
jgi:hypothetical protein